MCQDGQWTWTGEWPRHREGPWLTIEEMGDRKKPRPPLRQVGKPPLTGLPQPGEDDVRDRVATPAGWYSAFREATWEEALSLAAQQILRIRDEHGPDALGALSSAKCTNEDNYAFMRMVRGGVPHQQRGPLHPPLPLDLGLGDEPRAQHRGGLGLDAGDRGGVRRHLHRRRQHHRVPSGVRRPDQAGRGPRAPS